jgi:hypothetical protein
MAFAATDLQGSFKESIKEASIGDISLSISILVGAEESTVVAVMVRTIEF